MVVKACPKTVMDQPEKLQRLGKGSRRLLRDVGKGFRYCPVSNPPRLFPIPLGKLFNRSQQLQTAG